MSTKRRIAFHPATKISTGRISKAQLAGLSEPDGEFERQVAAIAETTAGSGHRDSTLPPMVAPSHTLLPLDTRALAVGLPSPELHLCAESAMADLTHTAWQGPPRGVGAGLYNLGNTCFLNATLQCLAYCPPLAQLLDDSDNDDEVVDRSKSESSLLEGGASARAALWGEGGGGQTFNVVKLLRELFERLHGQSSHGHGGAGQKPAEKAVSPKAIVASLRALGRQFRVGRQEDAHEFLCHLLDGLHKHCLRSQGLRPHDPSLLASRIGETSLVHRLFGGHLRSRLMCSTCQETSDKFEPFLDLSLQVKASGSGATGGGGGQAKANNSSSKSSSKADTVEAALERYTRGEVLEGDNQWQCPRCNARRNATKSLAIFRAPMVLCLQLKRFSFGRASAGRKILAPVAFPEQLNLPIAELDRKDGDGGSKTGAAPAAAASNDATNGAVTPLVAAVGKSKKKNANQHGQIKGDKSSGSDTGLKSFVGYNLTGALVHRGESVHSGHYYAFAKARNGVWHRFDDSEVHPVSLEVVLGQPAYLLFYTANGKDSGSANGQTNAAGSSDGVVNDSSRSSAQATAAGEALPSNGSNRSKTKVNGFEDVAEEVAEVSEEELGESVKPSSKASRTYSSTRPAAPTAAPSLSSRSVKGTPSNLAAASWMSSSFAAATARAEPDVPLKLYDDDDGNESDFNGAIVAAAAQRFASTQRDQNGLSNDWPSSSSSSSSSIPSSSQRVSHKLALDGWAVSFSAAGCGSRRFKPLHTWVRLPKPLWLLARDAARSQGDYIVEIGKNTAVDGSSSAAALATAATTGTSTSNGLSMGSSGGFKRSRSLQAEAAAAWRPPPPSSSAPSASHPTNAATGARKNSGAAAPPAQKAAPSAVATARGFATVDFAAEEAKLHLKTKHAKKKAKKETKLKEAPPRGSNGSSDHREANDANYHDRSSDQEAALITTIPEFPDSSADAANAVAATDKLGADPIGFNNNFAGNTGKETSATGSQRRPESLDPKRGYVSVANQPRGVKNFNPAGGERSIRGSSAAEAAAALPAWEVEDDGQGMSEQELAEARRQRFLSSGPRAKDPKVLQGKKKPRYDMWDAVLDAGKSKKVGKAARKREAAEAAVKAQARGDNPFERAGQVKAKAAKKQQAAEVAAAKAAIKHSTDI